MLTIIDQMKKFLSKITVLVCVTTLDCYGSSSENFLKMPC